MDVLTLVLVLISYNNLALNIERWYQYMDIIKEVLIDLPSLQYPRTKPEPRLMVGFAFSE